MANSYDVYLGGARTTNPDIRSLPSAAFNPLAQIKAAGHKNPIGYALTRVINPAPNASTTINGSTGDPAMRDWLDFQALSGVPVVQGDILRVVVLPGGSIFWGFTWEVENPLAGFAFSVAFSRIGNAAYVAGSQVIPNGTIGTVLLNNHSGATTGYGFVGCDGTKYTADTAVPGQFMMIGDGTTNIWDGIPTPGAINPPTPMPPSSINYANSGTPASECLAIRLDALPNSGTGATNWGNLRLKISPVLFETIRGQW